MWDGGIFLILHVVPFAGNYVNFAFLVAFSVMSRAIFQPEFL